MKKLIFVLSIIFSSIGCNTWENHVGMSENIEESLRRNVFICEYIPLKNPVIINDSIKIAVKSAWLEKQWMHIKDYNSTKTIDGYQLIIMTEEKIKEGYDKIWTIGVDFEKNIRTCGLDCLITDFDSIPTSEVEEWDVQQGWKLNKGKKKIIGKFSLKKYKP